MEPNIDRMQWSVVAMIAAVVVGGVILLAFPKISGKIVGGMEDMINKGFGGGDEIVREDDVPITVYTYEESSTYLPSVSSFAEGIKGDYRVYAIRGSFAKNEKDIKSLNKDKLIDITENLGSGKVDNVPSLSSGKGEYQYIFAGKYDNLKVGAAIDIPYIELKETGATSFNKSFNSRKFIGNPGMKDWDTSNIVDMRDAFYRAEKFNQNINDWDVSNVKDMSRMFQDATSFNQPLDKWVTSSLINMPRIFSGASSFNQNINDWDVSNVKNMYGIFYLAESFNQPLDKWGTDNVESLGSAFAFATSFNQDISKWNVEKVTNMSNLFAFANSMDQDLSDWNPARAYDLSGMFRGVTSKKLVDSLLSEARFNTQKINGGRLMIKYMFADIQVEKVDITNLAKGLVLNDDSLEGLFGNFESLTVPNLKRAGDGKRTKGVIRDHNYEYEFSTTSTPSFDLSGGSSIVNNAAHIINGVAWNYNPKVKLKYVEGLELLKGVQATNLSYMFANSHIENVDVSNWDISKTVSFQGMFMNYKGHISGLSTWELFKNSGNVGYENMDYMFAHVDQDLLGISGWDVSKLHHANGMFYGSRVNDNFESWNLSNLENAVGMFMNTLSVNWNPLAWSGKLNNLKHAHWMFFMDSQFINNNKSSLSNPNLLDKFVKDLDQLVIANGADVGTYYYTYEGKGYRVEINYDQNFNNNTKTRKPVIEVR